MVGLIMKMNYSEKLKKSCSVRLKELRESRNLTQEGLAVIIGISAPSLSRYENGDIPNAEVIYRYCLYFKVSADYIYGLSDLKKFTDVYIKDSEKIMAKAEAFDSMRCFIEEFEEKYASLKTKKFDEKAG